MPIPFISGCLWGLVQRKTQHNNSQHNSSHFSATQHLLATMSQTQGTTQQQQQQKQMTKRDQRRERESWVTPWSWFEDPWGEFRQLQKEINRLFRDFPMSERSEGAMWAPRVDVSETDKNLIIHAELPGIPKEKINIDFNEGVLTISGERSEERREENATYHRMERSYGKFLRQFSVPHDVDPNSITASYKDGVLEVVIPKPEQKKTRIAIQ